MSRCRLQVSAATSALILGISFCEGCRRPSGRWHSLIGILCVQCQPPKPSRAGLAAVTALARTSLLRGARWAVAVAQDGMGGRMMPRSASADCLLAPASAAAAPPAGPPPRQAPRRQGLALRLRGYRLGLRVPSEMWGATALALRLAQPPAGAAAHLQRSASVLAQVWRLIALDMSSTKGALAVTSGLALLTAGQAPAAANFCSENHPQPPIPPHPTPHPRPSHPRRRRRPPPAPCLRTSPRRWRPRWSGAHSWGRPRTGPACWVRQRSVRVRHACSCRRGRS